jgi:lipoate-protein ligase A
VTRLQVHFDGACDGAGNMARDTALLEAHQHGDDPILRIYRWDPPAVTIGYNQDLAGFDTEGVAAAGFGLVRRATGGRAILHADELTYAVVGTSPGPLFGSSLHETYMKINAALLGFLGELGLDADISDGESREEARGLVCFKSAGKHEISVGGRKLIGSAQRRRGDIFLQHGSILAGPRHLDLVGFLGEQADRDQLAAATTDLGQLLAKPLGPADLDAFAPALANAFGRVLDLETVWQDRTGRS